MRIKSLLVLIFVCALTAQGQVAARKQISPIKPSPALERGASALLPIRRVILYSNGVAYVERRGVVTGNAEINLSFKQSQIDDVLKSLVVLDLEGKIGAVSYNSSAPISARMAEIPFAVRAQTAEGGGLAGVLAQLQGAKVAVTTSGGTAVGAVLTVERKQIETEKQKFWTSVLVIASENGEISSVDLRDVRSVKLLDEGTRQDLSEFASATASARRRDSKTITITSSGSGPREMIVSYTIAAPIWKTTYRVVLDRDGKPFFQGWAIVDNVSEEDWQGVQLSLVSGSPVSFIQQLQKPFYRYRPIVPTPQDLQLNPQVYEPEGSIPNKDLTTNPPNATVGTTITQQQVQSLPTNTRNQSQLVQMQAGVSGGRMSSNQMMVDGVTSNFSVDQSSTTISDALQNSADNFDMTATGEEIGNLFEYRIEQPVTVMRDRSALIPIIQTKMDGERVAVYNEAVRVDRPFSGVLLKNLTSLTLESGSLTVIDGNAYAGEALMERLKPKEQRLISFALDLGTHVRVRNHEDREPAKLIKVVNGSFQVHYYQTSEKVYQISNQTDQPKVLYIEHPVQDGWQLSDKTPKPNYVTQRFYRFRVELEPFAEKDLVVSLRQPLMDNYQLSMLSKDNIALFVTRRYIDESARRKLEQLIELRTRIGAIDRKIKSFDDEEEKISTDQERLRENIESLSKTAEAKALIARYITKANEQETRLEAMDKERKALESERERLEAEFASQVRTFTLE